MNHYRSKQDFSILEAKFEPRISESFLVKKNLDFFDTFSDVFFDAFDASDNGLNITGYQPG